ncbi:MAG: type 4a pilus biogenesis protein PilO, partial [Candidatus Omnitrophica bacterium]|nr:type 4a pilus biogenesis protein PilO [Candidatus Omnitrophota bacterium]
DGFVKKPAEMHATPDFSVAPNSLKSAYFEVMPITLKVNGNFAAIIKLLECLQRYPRLLNVTDIKIQSTPNYPLLEGQVVIHAYRLMTKVRASWK